jgi:hypothetical protein
MGDDSFPSGLEFDGGDSEDWEIARAAGFKFETTDSFLQQPIPWVVRVSLEKSEIHILAENNSVLGYVEVN